ncbi:MULTISPECIES: hypothetical protein [Salimicrobium]|uniref:Voltage-gated potassium channel n=2 Tax=Salimicrobium TaxID=351195 RepID=A0ABY1KTY2_9BACI|nr:MULTISPECIES: hypothetical protein [Salimicrobium]SDY14715.1 voltage-gated potassium channel [Salimicrobium album]SIS77554.1 voltage-gated potassium channel [Salimicrobium salexigens]
MNRWKRRPGKTAYEVFMVLLASLSVATIWQEMQYDSLIVWGTWAIFFLDFLYRFFKSESKLDFVKKHPFIVIAAIPLDAVFQLARFARILHLLRLKSITKYYTKPFLRFLKRQHLGFVAGIISIVIFLLIIPLTWIEDELETYSDAFLSALLSITFFGRATFEPDTLPGQVIVVIFTILGVILHGLIISVAIDFLTSLPLFRLGRRKIKKIIDKKN